ncbi:MAG: methyltransferase domain-containing protein [Anaerolineae bacterium]|nr:methyltransferase domain-containing protein [Anaerolineae bacterium]
MSSVKQFDFFRPSFLWVPPRVDSPELLDQGVGTDEDVKANFADLRRINRYLGGIQAITQHLYPRLLAHAGTTTIVDIGSGAGDIGAAITRWGHQHRIDLKLWGLDLSARNLMLTRSNSDTPFDTRIQADAMQLPFKAGSVDYYLSSLFLHHFSPDNVKKLLAATFQSANKGIIMSDLTRGWLPMVGFKISQPIFARNFLTQHDGMASIRRAYTPDELLSLAQAAGLSNARVYRHPGWRMTLVAEK